MPYFSIIIPVYNRPDEVNDLLESLSKQTYKDFEVIIVEDGSTVCCADAVKNYYLCHNEDTMRFGIAKSETRFSFVSALTFPYL